MLFNKVGDGSVILKTVGMVISARLDYYFDFASARLIKLVEIFSVFIVGHDSVGISADENYRQVCRKKLWCVIYRMVAVVDEVL